jgi:hypothetical protein
MISEADATRIAQQRFTEALRLDITPPVRLTPIQGGWRFTPTLAGSDKTLGGVELAVRATDGAWVWLSTGATDADAAELLVDAPAH